MIPDPEKVETPETSKDNPYFSSSRMVVRLVAACFMVVGVLNLVAYWLKCRHDAVPMRPLRCVYLSIALVIGLVLLVSSSALARRAADYLDD